MSLIKRVKRITSARIDAFLDGLEDPETTYPQLLKELEEHLDSVGRAQEKAESAVQGAQRKVDEVNGRMLRYERGARQALEQDDVATARESLAAQLDAEQEAEVCCQELERASSAHADTRKVQQQLESELERLREDREEILGRAKLAEVREDVERLKNSAKTGESLLEQVGRIAGKVKEFAKELDQYEEEPEPETLEERLRRLNRETEIDARLNQLKEELSK